MDGRATVMQSNMMHQGFLVSFLQGMVFMLSVTTPQRPNKWPQQTSKLAQNDPKHLQNIATNGSWGLILCVLGNFFLCGKPSSLGRPDSRSMVRMRLMAMPMGFWARLMLSTWRRSPLPLPRTTEENNQLTIQKATSSPEFWCAPLDP